MSEEIDRITQVVMFIDIVESSLLYELNEAESIDRWRRLLAEVEFDILPKHQGKLIKSTGDGALFTFSDCRNAASCAFDIQSAAQRGNESAAQTVQIVLRTSIDIGKVTVDQHDVYGREVMRAARLLTLAGPGEIIVSAQVREHLTATLDADIEDLGECYLKHIQKPVRAYRVGPAGQDSLFEQGFSVGELRPTIAVIPFNGRNVSDEHRLLGDIIADDVIMGLSASPNLNVISRLSTRAFNDRDTPVTEIGQYLNANYVLSGAYRIKGDHISLDVELADVKQNSIVWFERLTSGIDACLYDDNEITTQVIAAVGRSIVSQELERAFSNQLPNLESYTLLVSAITLMHRLSFESFNLAHKMLQTLIGRATRQSIPQAWLAKWHVLHVQQGWSTDPQLDGRIALDCTKKALDADPTSALAHSIDGFVYTNLFHKLDVGQECYETALQHNPNESMAWLLKGTLHAFKGEGQQAVTDTQRASKLTPLDPLRYFYDSLSATASLAAQNYKSACIQAKRSIKANRTHTSTLRVLAASQWYLGEHDAARNTARELRELEPALTVSNWLARSPSADYAIGSEWARVLREVGIPD